MTITSRMPRAEYDAIDALNVSRLKNIKRSPQHYLHALTNRVERPCLVQGNAVHVAVLEPERYSHEFAMWTRRTEAGAMAPRKGQHWDSFKAECAGKTILTSDENTLAQDISDAVRRNELAMHYLAGGDPEVTLEWSIADELGGRPAKSRLDWITTIDGKPVLVGLKTARDCRRFAFGSQAAKLSYHWAWAFYHDAYESLTGIAARSVEIVVEVAAPHAVAVYRIPDDVIEQGREEYWNAVKLLNECEATGVWPGPEPKEEFLSLPSWAFGTDDNDLDDLGLTMENAA
jgi:hypothetical protein